MLLWAGVLRESDDISLIGHDSIYGERYIPASTVSIEPYEIGRQAFNWQWVPSRKKRSGRDNYKKKSEGKSVRNIK